VEYFKEPESFHFNAKAVKVPGLDGSGKMGKSEGNAIYLCDDETTIKNNISTKIQNYVNSIAPGDYLSIKDIILLGLNESGVEYFNIVSYSIDGETSTDIKVIQELETKFLFDSITWSGEV
jgi:tryptophanyl-tRNA synthetase